MASDVTATNGVLDVSVIGAGAVGAAMARELARYDLRVALVEAGPDVGVGTSKASTAIWHTGFDAKPGSLEARLMRRSYPLMDRFMVEANIAHERLGAILIAWNPAQQEALPGLLKKAHENGVTDVTILSAAEIYQREPNINQGALGGLLVPGEGILCTYSVPLACAYQAVVNGVQLLLNWPVQSAQREGDAWLLTSRGAGSAPKSLRARYVINAAGLQSDVINGLFGHQEFSVTPRRGQLIVYDKLSRPLVRHVLLPVPTAVTKGVLISPTVYGNILLGPTAEDLDDKSATQTTADGLNMLTDKGRMILPQLLGEEVTATYSGLRAATQHSDYQIQMHGSQHYLCLGGIRSTGISAALGIAEHGVELLAEAGLSLRRKAEFSPVRLPSIGQADLRPLYDAGKIAVDSAYARVVCHCEGVTLGELRDALRAPVPATTLDGLRRRTRASQGRCQGFNCHAALQALVKQSADGQEQPTCAALAPCPHRGHAGAPAPVTRSAEVLIVGAGPAGLAAAIELKKRGIRDVIVVDREQQAGGTPRLCDHVGFGREDLWRLYRGPAYARHYRDLAEKWQVQVHTSTTVTGWGGDTSKPGSDGAKLRCSGPGGVGEVQARAVLLATGVRERPRSARMVPGTRPIGVYTTGSLQRFLHQEHLPIGKRAVIVGAELVSLSALMMLWEAGVSCAMMVTEQPRPQVYMPFLPMQWALTHVLMRTPIVTGARVSNILGHQRVEAIELSRQDGSVQTVECDTVIFTGSWIPENELARVGGVAMDPGSHGPSVDGSFRSSRRGVFAAGNLLRGVETADRCALEGGRAAASIAAYLQGDPWPPAPLAIRCEEPLQWICPNLCRAGEAVSRFHFRSNQFRNDVELRIRQGDKVVHSERRGKLIVNETMSLGGAWTRDLDPQGGTITVGLA